MLKPDGTYDTDDNGQYVPTYDNDDLMSFARVWTGFYRNAIRNNGEQRSAQCFTPGGCGNFDNCTKTGGSYFATDDGSRDET